MIKRGTGGIRDFISQWDMSMCIRLRQNTLSLATGVNGGEAPVNFAEIPWCMQQGTSLCVIVARPDYCCTRIR